MQLLSIAPWRWVWPRRAKFPPMPDISLTPHISDKIARDIGLSRHEIEVLRHQWPSESPHRATF